MALKINPQESHLDHALPPEVVALLVSRYADRDGFFIDSFELPPELPPVPCTLHGPATGEPPVTDAEVTMIVRPPRPYPSRICQRPPVLTRTITVIAGPHEEEPCLLYTAFGGPLAPKEPEDQSLGTEDDRAASRAFWAQHALNL